MPQAKIILPQTDIEANAVSFRRHLRAENLSPKTTKTYGEAIDQLACFLRERGMPGRLAHIRREHVESFIEHLLERWAPATAANRYGGLRAFFSWAVDEGEIKDSPMAKMKPPRVPERAVPILSETEIAGLFKVCAGQEFEPRRDLALLRLYAVTGARKTEIANLRYDPSEPANNDIDLEAGVARVIGKGNRDRLLPLDPKTIRAIDRYLRVRSAHHSAHLQALWLGKRGAMTGDGIAQMAYRRAKKAGIEDFHLHRFRHSFAHFWLSDGGGESDLMRLTGWRSRTMLSRYGSSAAQERALAASKRFGLGNRI